MTDETRDPAELAPAFYASAPGGLRDWWTLLHPPYTLWHLSYVVIGASLAPDLNLLHLGASVLAFFLAVGIAAHALDELQGRPLRTRIPSAVLAAAAVLSLAAAAGLGGAGITRLGWGLAPFILLGVLFVCGYNLEWFGGRLHTDFGFAFSWGAFPVLVGYFAQTGTIHAAAVVAAAAAYGLSAAQRTLSTPARTLRRRVRSLDGSLTLNDGSKLALDTPLLLRPLERSLRILAYSVVGAAGAMLIARLY